MVLELADNRRPQSLASGFRRRRMSWLFELISHFDEPVRILDVGGTPDLWLQNLDSLPRRCRITFLNLQPVSTRGLDDAVALVGDARKLTGQADGAYDVGFSNSVIEHVGTLYDQMAMAGEIRRVCHSYFVQTPNRYFPLEPHFLVPGWQFLPARLRAAIYRRLTLGWMPRQPDWFLARAEVEQVRLLTRGEMRRLFPDGRLVLEKIGPFVKSLVAIRAPATAA